MAALAPVKYPVRWLMLSVLLVTSVPTVLLLVVTCKTVTDMYYSDWTDFVAKRVAVAVQSTSTLQEARSAVETVLSVNESSEVTVSSPDTGDTPFFPEGLETATTLETEVGPYSFSSIVYPRNPFSNPCLYITLPFRTPSEKIVVKAALHQFIPSFSYHFTMLLTVAGTLLLLIVYNSLVFAATIEQKLTAAELHRRRLQRSLLQTSKLAAMGTLSAGIAHELNTPISIMVQEAGWIEDVLEDEQEDSNSEIRKSTRVIAEQGARCRDITHNLLMVAHKDVERSSIINVNSLVQEVLLYAASRARNISVELEADLDSATPFVAASLTNVQQILFNLISNSLDSMEEQGGVLRVATAVLDQQVNITVSDTGPGIPPALQARVFEPFFTTKPAGKGTGLGLSICHSLALRNKGTLSVKNNNDKGCIFTLQLPRFVENSLDGTEAADTSSDKGASHVGRSS